MNWLWPGFLFLLAALPILVALYIWALRRRRRFAVRYSSLSLIRAALPQHSRLKRHLPFALFLLALTSLVLALGRPVASVNVPDGQATIILAMDVSRSMLANDIPPSRLAAAQTAALSFIQTQPANAQIGIVAFAGFAEMVQAPTSDQASLEAAIAGLSTSRGTAIGSGLLESLDVIAELDPDVAPSVRGPQPDATAAPVAEGSYAPAIIVLLTDGVNSTGPLPLEAAQQAVERGIRVYTIGFGTENGSLPSGGGQSGDGRFGGGGGWRRGIDEETLQQVAEMTDGAYYAAESVGELQQVFQNLPTYLSVRKETTELSVAFIAFGALLAAAAIGISLLRHLLP